MTENYLICFNCGVKIPMFEQKYKFEGADRKPCCVPCWTILVKPELDRIDKENEGKETSDIHTPKHHILGYNWR